MRNPAPRSQKGVFVRPGSLVARLLRESAVMVAHSDTKVVIGNSVELFRSRP